MCFRCGNFQGSDHCFKIENEPSVSYCPRERFLQTKIIKFCLSCLNEKHNNKALGLAKSIMQGLFRNKLGCKKKKKWKYYCIHLVKKYHICWQNSEWFQYWIFRLTQDLVLNHFLISCLHLTSINSLTCFIDLPTSQQSIMVELLWNLAS